MDDLEQRILNLEAESAVQNAWIRALTEMLPMPHPKWDAPLLRVIDAVKAQMEGMDAQRKAAYEAALAKMNPLSMPRHWSPRDDYFS